MNDLISEFFYDGIRRIIPGLVVIALYLHQEAANVLTVHKDFSPVAFIACILLVAWLVGFLIEQVMFIIVCEFLWRVGGKDVLKWFRDKWKVGPAQHEPITDPDQFHEKRRFAALLFAEKVMSRSLSAIFCWAWVFDHWNLGFIKHTESLSIIQWRPWYFFVGFLAFGCSWALAVIKEPPPALMNSEAVHPPPIHKHSA
jgi:hypothetical protein